MGLKKIRYSDSNVDDGATVCYELDAAGLPLEKSKQLEALVERCGILEYKSEHRGPAKGEHQISIIVESSDGPHEATACDVPLAADDEELVSFIKSEGTKVENFSKALK